MLRKSVARDQRLVGRPQRHVGHHFQRRREAEQALVDVQGGAAGELGNVLEIVFGEDGKRLEAGMDHEG